MSWNHLFHSPIIKLYNVESCFDNIFNSTFCHPISELPMTCPYYLIFTNIPWLEICINIYCKIININNTKYKLLYLECNNVYCNALKFYYYYVHLFENYTQQIFRMKYERTHHNRLQSNEKYYHRSRYIPYTVTNSYTHTYIYI